MPTEAQSNAVQVSSQKQPDVRLNPNRRLPQAIWAYLCRPYGRCQCRPTSSAQWLNASSHKTTFAICAALHVHPGVAVTVGTNPRGRIKTTKTASQSCTTPKYG